MSCMTCGTKEAFPKSLYYSSPAHGGWGVLKAAHLLPESYHLFVSPAGCGRHGALGACLDGRKNRVSYLFLKEEDIVSGGYEDALVQAVEKLLNHLKKCGRLPKVLGIFVSCIDDLLATDHDALLEELKSLHPEVKFTFCHMNPTSTDSSVPPPVNIQNKNYEMLEVAERKDKGVNIIGNFAPLRENSELFTMLKEMGAEKIRHISDYKSFEKYQEMAQSCLNIVVAPSGKYSAVNMKKKHGMDYELLFTTFRKEKIEENYSLMAKVLGSRVPEQEKYRQEYDRALKEAGEELADMPVVISGESIVRPFDLARALLEGGIRVGAVHAQQLIPSDQENYSWVCENYPQVKILQPQSPQAALRKKEFDQCLAIGYSAAYQSDTGYVVDIDGQHGLYGYQGMIDLLEMMKKAARQEVDLKQILEEAVLIV